MRGRVSSRLLSERACLYRNGNQEAMAAGEAIVKAHIAAHPELMGIPAKERAAAHT